MGACGKISILQYRNAVSKGAVARNVLIVVGPDASLPEVRIAAAQPGNIIAPLAVALLLDAALSSPNWQRRHHRLTKTMSRRRALRASGSGSAALIGGPVSDHAFEEPQAIVTQVEVTQATTPDATTPDTTTAVRLRLASAQAHRRLPGLRHQHRCCRTTRRSQLVPNLVIRPRCQSGSPLRARPQV